MKNAFKTTTFLLSGALLVSTARADVRPNALFSDNAVLQRDKAVPVWGTADPNEAVTVTFNGQAKTATAGADGAWMVNLDPLKAGGPFEMTLAGKNTVTLKDVLVGEVWICSGQSNMEMGLPMLGNPAEIAGANFPNIRLYTVRRNASLSPQTLPARTWKPTTPETISAEGTWTGFSAAAYYFGREIHQKLGVPVGLIESAWGGTYAEPWTSRAALAGAPEFQALVNGPLPKSVGATTPGALYNGMIAPLLPYAMRGVIWYQGESNALLYERAIQYRQLMPLLIADWRKNWGGQDFPFLFVQIAPYRDMVPEIREAQFLTLKKSPNTALVVTTDAGDANDIHPKQKQPVGERLALAARALAYGEKIEYSGPLYDSMQVAGNRATVNFSHIGSGLDAKDGPLKGFTIAGEDKKFVPAMAVIQGKTVVLSSDAVAKPVAVRYGWATVPDVNLINKEGLPASPFRTDTEATDRIPTALALAVGAAVIPSPNAANNLAANKPVVSSDPNFGSWGKNLTNGSWSADALGTWASNLNPTFPKTATIDLGQVTNVGQALIGVPPFGSTKTITVSLSTDGTTFTEAGSHVFAPLKEERFLYSFAPRDARFVRLTYPDFYPPQPTVPYSFPSVFSFTTEAEVFAPGVKVSTDIPLTVAPFAKPATGTQTTASPNA